MLVQTVSMQIFWMGCLKCMSHIQQTGHRNTGGIRLVVSTKRKAIPEGKCAVSDTAIVCHPFSTSTGHNLTHPLLTHSYLYSTPTQEENTGDGGGTPRTIITYHMDSSGPGCHQSQWNQSSHLRPQLRIWPVKLKEIGMFTMLICTIFPEIDLHCPVVVFNMVAGSGRHCISLGYSLSAFYSALGCDCKLKLKLYFINGKRNSV